MSPIILLTFLAISILWGFFWFIVLMMNLDWIKKKFKKKFRKNKNRCGPDQDQDNPARV
jgi:hypothetical protein